MITRLRGIERWLDDRQLRRDAALTVTSAGLAGLAVARTGQWAVDTVTLAARQGAVAGATRDAVNSAYRQAHAVLLLVAAVALLALLGVGALVALAAGRRVRALARRGIDAGRRAVTGFWRGTDAGSRLPASDAGTSTTPASGPPPERIAEPGDDFRQLARAVVAMSELLRARASGTDHSPALRGTTAFTTTFTATAEGARRAEQTPWWVSEVPVTSAQPGISSP